RRPCSPRTPIARGVASGTRRSSDPACRCRRRAETERRCAPDASDTPGSLPNAATRWRNTRVRTRPDICESWDAPPVPCPRFSSADAIDLGNLRRRQLPRDRLHVRVDLFGSGRAGDDACYRLPRGEPGKGQLDEAVAALAAEAFELLDLRPVAIDQEA